MIQRGYAEVRVLAITINEFVLVATPVRSSFAIPVGLEWELRRFTPAPSGSRPWVPCSLIKEAPHQLGCDAVCFYQSR